MYSLLTQFGANCGTFLGIPTWYEYLDSCSNPTIGALSDIWLIVLAILDMLFSVAVLVTVTLFLWGSMELIWARGNPESIASGRSRIVNSLIGLAIAFLSTTIVSYVAARIGGAG